MVYIIHCIPTKIFRLLLLPSSGRCYYYNTMVQMWLSVWYTGWNISNRYTTPSAHHLQPVPTGIPHHLHITYKQFHPVYHTVRTSPTTISNRYTTPSTHHLQPVPTGILHRPHITYNQFQPVHHTVHITYKQFQPIYHTVHTSPTTSSNQYNKPSIHHLQTFQPIYHTVHTSPTNVPTGLPHRPQITYKQFQTV